jgi:hypothetical protein
VSLASTSTSLHNMAMPKCSKSGFHLLENAKESKIMSLVSGDVCARRRRLATVKGLLLQWRNSATPKFGSRPTASMI